MIYTAFDVANWFIKKSLEQNYLITHLKVQKLLYYAEAWVQVLLSRQLFIEKIYAYSHGVIVYEVEEAFKSYGLNLLNTPNTFDLSMFDSDVTDVLEQVFNTYAEFSARKLELMIKLDIEQCEEIVLNGVISKLALKKYFKEKYVL